MNPITINNEDTEMQVNQPCVAVFTPGENNQVVSAQPPSIAQSHNETQPTTGTQPYAVTQPTAGTQPTTVSYPNGGTWSSGNAQLMQTKLYKKENAFKPDMCDFVVALITFILGYLFLRWVIFDWQGWGVTVFTTAYLLTVTTYLTKKGVFTNCGATWFWLSVTFVTGLSYMLWVNEGFGGIRALFLFGAAVYYVIVASGRNVMGKTGNYLLIDGLNAVLLIPFHNYINQYVSFVVLKKDGKSSKILHVMLGLMLSLILASILIPMLIRADSGGFGMILKFFTDTFRFIDIETVFYLVLAIPVAAYLYGLLSGVAHKKGTNIMKLESAKQTVAELRFLQPATINTVLGVVCGIYLIFIFSQIPYFFSAFTGRRPEGWLIYAEYARQGFFELCAIAAINLVILIVGNITSKKQRSDSPVLKLFNIALAVITLLLIATAFSKMALYIDAYGLTMPRLLPCVLMAFLAFVFIALIALQKLDFSIVRFALVAGSIILCILCISNPDALVVRYNTTRYLNGTLPGYDTEILYRSGSAGVLPAVTVYETTKDEALRSSIAQYFRDQIWYDYSAYRQSIESYQAQKRLEGLQEHGLTVNGNYTRERQD